MQCVQRSKTVAKHDDLIQWQKEFVRQAEARTLPSRDVRGHNHQKWNLCEGCSSGNPLDIFLQNLDIRLGIRQPAVHHDPGISFVAFFRFDRFESGIGQQTLDRSLDQKLFILYTNTSKTGVIDTDWDDGRAWVGHDFGRSERFRAVGFFGRRRTAVA